MESERVNAGGRRSMNEERRELFERTIARMSE